MTHYAKLSSSGTGEDYTYDGNGNLTKDSNRGITGITWNALNLPRQVLFSASARNVSYIYDAEGKKLRTNAANSDATRLYAENFEYNSSGFLLRVGLEEGQLIRNTNGTYEVHYYLKDHLGNVRQVLKEDGTVLQETEYFAFGMAIPKSGNDAVNKYQYNGKEKQPETGWLDYGARMYMPEIGRWGTVDNKANLLPSWSPYTFALNNPIVFVDPDGQFPYTFHIRAFAPTGAFKGTGFHDDGRGFSTNTDVTSRIQQNFTIDPTARTYSGGTPTSHPTYWNGIDVGTATNKGGVSKPEFGTNSLGSATASLSSNFEGSNPALKGLAPNIDVGSSLSITENLKKGQVIISFDLSSKQFPATEGFVQDAAGNSVFLGGAAAYGDAKNLITADKKQVSTVDLIIGINDKGIFQNVTLGGKTYTLGEFEKFRTSNPAGPFPREDKDK